MGRLVSEGTGIRPDKIQLIIGKGFSGKSYFLKNYMIPLLLKSYRRFIIWDYNYEHNPRSNKEIVAYDLETVVKVYNGGYIGIIYRPKTKTAYHFAEFCKIVDSMEHITFICEEVPLYATSHYESSQPSLKNINDTGRHRGIGVIYTARRVLKLCADIPYNAENIFIFSIDRPQDVRYIAEYVGLTKDQMDEKLSSLQSHGFLWWHEQTGIRTMNPV